MKVGRQFVVGMLLVWVLSGTGCKQKTVQTVPPHGQAPTIAVALPPKIPETPAPVPVAPPKPEQPELPPPKQKTPAKRNRKKPPAQNSTPAQGTETAPSGETAAAAGTTTSAANGNTTVATNRPPASPGGEGTVDVAIAPQVSNEQANHQKETATQMLDATEKNLKSLKPDLSKDQQAMVNQIRSYMAQSRKALSENDFERAANLATKARLLSDALVQK